MRAPGQFSEISLLEIVRFVSAMSGGVIVESLTKCASHWEARRNNFDFLGGFVEGFARERGNQKRPHLSGGR